MNITQVQYALEIARRGSITKAAEQLYISQPALSEQMKALEAELECTLFRRTARGTALTEAGVRFCGYAEPALRAWEKLQQNCADLKDLRFQSLRIGFGLRARSNGLFEPLVSFFDGYQDVNFSFTTDMNQNFPEAVENGGLDIAFERLYDHQVRELSDRIAVMPLLSEPQCILMSREDPLAQYESLPFQVLDGKAAVCGPIGSGDDLEMKSMCDLNGIRVSRVLRADDINAVMALVQRKKGYALGPVSFADYFGVAAVPLEPDLEIALNLICRKGDQDSFQVHKLYVFLKEMLDQTRQQK